jgi:chromosome segregation protein
MRLKRLETYGFKSFADRLTFDFEPGITAIIGPNGCGKSNVVDAIKWVVGEQSAKALRGGEMLDVIFNGCATRRPMPLSEVTLTLEDINVMGQQEDIAITRRLTREGQSSYFINGRSTRLKDIRELLMGTGIGTSAYSTIEQGRIGFILEASVKERRLILEEASGISRYKSQRKIALRKLDRVNADLERIGQVLSEVEKQLRSVRRQAEKALRYQELSERLRELRLVFALEEYGRLHQLLAELRKAIAACQDQEGELAAKLAELDAVLSEADGRMAELDEQIRSQQQERADVQSRRDVAAAQAKDAKNRLVEIDQQEEEDHRVLTGYSEKLQALQTEQADTEASLGKLEDGDDDDQGLGNLYEQRKVELDRVMAAIDELIQQVEQRKGKEVETLRELTRLASELSHCETTAKTLREREGRLRGRNQGHDQVLEQACGSEQEAQAAVDEALAMAAEAHRNLDELIQAREQAAAEAQGIESKLNDLRHEEGRAETRYRILADYEKRAEGLSAGARGILKQMDRFPGIRGLVADLFRVEKDYELAIETALGGAVQNIVAETASAAKEAIEFLKRERRGRATFLPLDDVQGRGQPERGLLREAGVVGVASELIRFDKEYRPAFEHLLGNILVLETLDHAMDLRRRHRPRCRLVTLDGDVVAPGGAMTGGRHQGSSQGGLVSRKNEIRRLETRLQDIGTERQGLMESREGAKKRAFELSMEVEQQRKQIQTREREVGDLKAQLMKAERDRIHAEEFADSFSSEVAEIQQELEQLETDRIGLEVKQAELENLKTGLDEELQRVQVDLTELGKQRDSVQEEVGNLRVNMATTAERREALRNHIGHLRKQLDDLAETRAERERRIAGHQQKREELRTVAVDNTEIHEREAEAFRRLSETLDAMIKERDQLFASVETQRQEHRKLSAKRRDIEQEHQAKELKAQEQEVRSQTLGERILELYDIDLAEAYSNWERPDNIDWPTLRKELDETEREFSKLGPVNLAAIDELKEVEARYEFLAKQHSDLTDAATKLDEIITDINETSRKLFKKTYREVRRNFQELFRKLYGGGKADLVLEQDVDDILEAGIDIMAQPPGKHPKNISLLSGGEKALTAVALLFAVYLTKPSPFCILDEVDAPLDESNTDVYCQMLREFVNKSQFLVITHNKRTMQYADAIYGVTQAEQGVSTKISVKLEELENPDDLVATSRGAGPFAG